jgi:hypothetical protein
MRRCALVLIAVLFAAACDGSHLKADQTVVISGRALSATGAPLADVPVHLSKESGSAHNGFATTTDAKGTYRFRIKGSDTQNSAGDADTLDVLVADPDGTRSAAARTTLRFTVQHDVVRLPAARLWDAGLHVAATTAGPPAIRMAWRAESVGDPSYTVALFDSARRTLLWTQPASGTRARIDARLLEDSAGLAAVTARADLGSGVNAAYRSGRRPVRPLAGNPPSRHEPCYALTGSAAPFERFRQAVCAATDGDLVSPSRLVAGNGEVVTGVLVDLVAQTRFISLIVVRGLVGTVVVEISPDSHTWTRIATATGPTIAVRPPEEPLARYIRVRSPNGLDESRLAEVSVW